jgi:hypothetical protein
MQVVPSAEGIDISVIPAPSYEITPVNLSFSASGVTDPHNQGLSAVVATGDLLMGLGSVIETDPQTASTKGVSLSGQTVSVLGTVLAPGGTIAVKGASNSAALFGGTGALPTVDLGPKSVLSTAGTTVLTADIFGNLPGSDGYLESGYVLPGGTISVSGNIVAESGALLDVSGWSDERDPGGLLYMAPAVGGTSLSSAGSPSLFPLVPTVDASSGGSIVFVGQQELFADATLNGAAGGPSSTGGSLSISCAELGGTSAAVFVTQSGPTIPVAFYGQAESAIGHAVMNADGSPVINGGHFAVDSFAAGAFDSLALHGVVTFIGDVDISAKGSLSVADGGLLYANGSVNLEAPYVALGQPYLSPVLPSEQLSPFSNLGSPVYYPPVFGPGNLTVSAGSERDPGLIDMGNLSLQQIGEASFTADGGDIRGFGTVDIAGSITMAAECFCTDCRPRRKSRGAHRHHQSWLERQRERAH